MAGRPSKQNWEQGTALLSPLLIRVTLWASASSCMSYPTVFLSLPSSDLTKSDNKWCPRFHLWSNHVTWMLIPDVNKTKIFNVCFKSWGHCVNCNCRWLSVCSCFVHPLAVFYLSHSHRSSLTVLRSSENPLVSSHSLYSFWINQKTCCWSTRQASMSWSEPWGNPTASWWTGKSVSQRPHRVTHPRRRLWVWG